jgi:hypothetical protein
MVCGLHSYFRVILTEIIGQQASREVIVIGTWVEICPFLFSIKEPDFALIKAPEILLLLGSILIDD